MTTTLERPSAASEPSRGRGRAKRMPSNGWLLLGVLVVWVLGLVARSIAEDKMDPDQAAQKWVDANPDKVNAWLQAAQA